MEDVSLILSIVWFVSVFVGSIIGKKKGKRMKAVLLTLCLGVIGLIIVIAMKPTEEIATKNKVSSGEMRKCPSCAELVQKEAKVCKHCGHDLPEISEGKL